MSPLSHYLPKRGIARHVWSWGTLEIDLKRWNFRVQQYKIK
jgi:hypothetical protein